MTEEHKREEAYDESFAVWIKQQAHYQDSLVRGIEFDRLQGVDHFRAAELTEELLAHEYKKSAVTLGLYNEHRIERGLSPLNAPELEQIRR